MNSKAVLLIEAFYGGSHKQLIDLLMNELSEVCDLFTMPAKKWHWRSITSALHFSEIIPTSNNYRYLFTSSVMPLADLIALRPDLAQLYKIVYFHENQLTYPVQEWKTRYFQHSYNELLTCLSADKVLFNSSYNKESFLSSLSSYFNIMPDFRPKNLESKLRPKCSVLYFPLDDGVKSFSEYKTNISTASSEVNMSTEVPDKLSDTSQEPLHIVWPHRWEHDKDPDSFFSVIFRLKENGLNFKLSIIGENYSEKPDAFENAYKQLKSNIAHWGYIPNKEEYFRVLSSADVVVSTAKHEFFGVSMLEAVGCGCYPLCPNNLVYPEIYPGEYLYNTFNQLYKKLKYFCKTPSVVRQHKVQVDVTKFSWCNLRESYRELFETHKKMRCTS